MRDHRSLKAFELADEVALLIYRAHREFIIRIPLSGVLIKMSNITKYIYRFCPLYPGGIRAPSGKGKVKNRINSSAHL
ncbi:MAG: hypothetical protein JRC68_03845 [Deltaproteobacteria bacterium]|nr:hypothetical protein [Deltaproteobacteria bacterium]